MRFGVEWALRLGFHARFVPDLADGVNPGREAVLF
jgi:hypothetical protein